MNKLTLLAAVVLGLLQFGLLSGCDKHARDKIEMRAAWDQYMQGYASSNGEMAVQVLSQKTLDHYARLVKIGLDAKAQDVWALPPTQMKDVFYMRCRSTRKELKSLDGHGFVKYAVNNGWYSGADEGWKVGAIAVNGAGATATVHHPEWEAEYNRDRLANTLSRRGRYRNSKMDKPFTFSVQFVKEGTQWKLDEMSVLSQIDAEITEASKAARKSVRDYLMAVESDDQDRKIPMSVWDPMKK